MLAKSLASRQAPLVERWARREGRFARLTHVYHVELRQFPHNFCRFNLTERQLNETILDAWAREEWVDFGERKWNPHQATLTVLDGPEIPVAQLSMGRGWRTAQRQGRDVTEQAIAAARQAAGAGQGSRRGSDADGQAGAVRASPSPPFDAGALSDSLGAAVLALLGDDPGSLVRAWRVALESHPDRTPSECLALAEDLVRR
jgi:hypothetical protein